MPLKLIPPRKGRSQNWRVRGTYLGISVDRSTGTSKKKTAKQRLKDFEAEIESGQKSGGKRKTFVEAVVIYLKAGGEKRYVTPLLEHFKNTPIDEIDQSAINAAAAILYPPGISEEPSPHNATINRQVHTPVGAILTAAGRPLRLARPRQPKEKARWITPKQAQDFLDTASPKLRKFTLFLLATGCRVTEACKLPGDDWHPEQALAYIRDTKNGEARAAHLPNVLLNECIDLKPKPNDRVFGYRDRWEVYDDWNPTRELANLPEWFTPHACCHTWATWMRQYSKSDLRGLIGTGRWKDIKSVMRYQHVVATEESKKADLLPLTLSSAKGKKAPKASDSRRKSHRRTKRS